ncbi:bile acid:sodium symporter family protein [Amphibiibacter pelophylacis]|uniref:Bile acid:sodium symporter family protein n=1 Tax=Amphibiibacter pelophylacis TaxID=1799477 RepID=A0ACC6P0D7_9BURK
MRIPGMDPFIVKLLLCVALASVLPVHGPAAQWMNTLTTAAVALLFFLHGARLSRESLMSGLTHWRLHLAITACTFAMFPLIGLALQRPLDALVTPSLTIGFLFLCALPSTVQSAIAFTSIARGNVAAAVCSASGSSLLGVFLTPLLVSLIIDSSGEARVSLDAIGKIVLQLLLPFVLGQLARPWLQKRLEQRAALVKHVDQGSILLVVYTAFSEAVVQGLWRDTPPLALAGVVLASCVLLALMLTLTWTLGRVLGFSMPDRITLFMCGSKKSLASGAPMAHVLFAGPMLGSVMLPLMVFHQIQLMVCAWLAARWGERPAD